MEVDAVANPQGDGNNAIPTREMLLANFENLDETKQQIFWFYYLYLFTDGGVGGNPEMAASY